MADGRRGRRLAGDHRRCLAGPDQARAGPAAGRDRAEDAPLALDGRGRGRPLAAADGPAGGREEREFRTRRVGYAVTVLGLFYRTGAFFTVQGPFLPYRNAAS